MLVNGKTSQQLAGWTPDWVHLPSGVRPHGECDSGIGRKGRICLLALDYLGTDGQSQSLIGFVGDNGQMVDQMEIDCEKGCQPAKAGIHEHSQGGMQPGLPFYEEAI